MNRRKLLLLGITLFFLVLLAAASRSTASVPRAPGDRIPDWEAAGPGGNGHALFGFSVRAAGDVNGDGYGDVIIGARDYSVGQGRIGRASVFHGSSTGLSTAANWITDGNPGDLYVGISVSGAGDVNGDGYADVVVGAHLSSHGQTSEGRAYVFHGSADGLSITPAWTGQGDQVDAQFGHSVSTAGDVNGDGYADVIVGAANYNNGEPDEGRAYVYYGSASGLSTTPDWTAENNEASSGFGYAVNTAGDVNGDGYEDVIIGAYVYGNAYTKVYVYLGSTSGLSLTHDWIEVSPYPGSSFGYSVSTAGDVNTDGYDDVIIGAPDYSGGQTKEGAAMVYYGSAEGLGNTANWLVESNHETALLGSSVSTAGDMNGDGYADVIIGAPSYYTPGYGIEGRVFAYYGSSGGLRSTYAWTDGGVNNGAFGNSVAWAGDVNADGEADVVVGSPMYERSYGYYGLPEVPPTSTPTPTPTRTATATRTATPTPTALGGVDLLYFLAESGEGQVLLKWETASELNNAGFFVMRSLDIAGPYLRISGFIPSQGDGITGAYYEYPDHDVVAGMWYHYILEMVDIGGASVFTEPVSVLYGGSTITRNPTLSSSPSTTPTVTSTVTPTRTQQPNIRIYIPAVFNH